MACGQCAAARARREAERAAKALATNSVNSKKTLGDVPVIVSGNSPKPKRAVYNGVCGHLYDELRILDGKVYSLFKRTRFDGTGDDYHWLEVQREIREWMKNLNDVCPDEDKLNAYRELVNGEFIKLGQ